MKAMILAAGRGQRMMPLTQNTAKPLLLVGGKPLICWHIEALVKAGIRQIVINHHFFAQQFIDLIGNGSRFGAEIQWSLESQPLETAGGIIQALPMLGNEPFIVVNADIWCDFPYARLINHPLMSSGCEQQAFARLVLVSNPEHNKLGDFEVCRGWLKNPAADTDYSSPLKPSINSVSTDATNSWTYSGIGLFSPSLFAECEKLKPLPLSPILRRAAAQQQIQAEIYQGQWYDIGTPQRLTTINQLLKRI